jgi:hypothetical protein
LPFCRGSSPVRSKVTLEAVNAFPIKTVDGHAVFMRDVAHVHDGFQVQTNSVAVNGTPGEGWGTTPNVGKHIWSFGPGAIWPLLDFGALDAQVDIANLEAHLRLVNYR